MTRKPNGFGSIAKALTVLGVVMAACLLSAGESRAWCLINCGPSDEEVKGLVDNGSFTPPDKRFVIYSEVGDIGSLPKWHDRVAEFAKNPNYLDKCDLRAVELPSQHSFGKYPLYVHFCPLIKLLYHYKIEFQTEYNVIEYRSRFLIQVNDYGELGKFLKCVAYHFPHGEKRECQTFEISTHGDWRYDSHLVEEYVPDFGKTEHPTYEVRVTYITEPNEVGKFFGYSPIESAKCMVLAKGNNGWVRQRWCK